VAVAAVAAMVVSTLVYAERIEPLTVFYGGIWVNGAPLDTSTQIPTVTYTRDSTIYVGIGLQNDSAIPITIEGVVTTPERAPSGYRPTGILVSASGQPATHTAFDSTTIAPHGQAVFDVVFSATTRCGDLPLEPPQSTGFTGATYHWAEIRYSVAGLVPRTETVTTMAPFRVPQPGRAACVGT